MCDVTMYSSTVESLFTYLDFKDWADENLSRLIFDIEKGAI